MQSTQAVAEHSIPLLVLLSGDVPSWVMPCDGFDTQVFGSADELAEVWLNHRHGIVLVDGPVDDVTLRRLRAVLPDAALVVVAPEADEIALLELGVQEVICDDDTHLPRSLNRALVRIRLEHTRSRDLYQDPLTGLANRHLFLDRLDHALVQGKRHGTSTGLLYMGIERFRIINELHGYAAGDELLVACARRLQDTLRRSDTLARIGGDVFAVVLGNVPDEITMNQIADKVRQAFSAPFLCAGTEVFLGVSIGMELSGRANSDSGTMLRHAELAMHRVRRDDHRSFLLYEDDHSPADRVRAGLESALYHALERNELRLVYQPQLNISSGAFSGVEVLLRWSHPVLGDVSPVVFIPVLEETGLIARFGEWVLANASLQFAQWLNAGVLPDNAVLSVNLSPRQFGQPDLVARIRHSLQEAGLAPDRLTLEITESTLMRNMDQGVSVLNELRQLGVAIAIDDFGTGYSSLAYLKDLPIDYLKIDRVFVKDVVTNTHDAAIASSIISLAHNLGLKVTAEGVEDQQILDLLRLFGCDQYQGFFFSRPVGADDIPGLAALCRSHNASN